MAGVQFLVFLCTLQELFCQGKDTLVSAVLTQENTSDPHNEWWVTGHKHRTVNFP